MIKTLFKVLPIAFLFALNSCSRSVSVDDIATIDSLLTSFAEVYTVDFDTKSIDDLTKIDYSVLHLYKVSPQKFQEGNKSYIVKIDQETVANVAKDVFITPIVKHQSTNEVDYNDGFYEIRRPSESDEYLFCKTEPNYTISNDTLTVKAGVYSAKNNTPSSQATLYKTMQTKIIISGNKFKVAEYREVL